MPNLVNRIRGGKRRQNIVGDVNTHVKVKSVQNENEHPVRTGQVLGNRTNNYSALTQKVGKNDLSLGSSSQESCSQNLADTLQTFLSSQSSVEGSQDENKPVTLKKLSSVTEENTKTKSVAISKEEDGLVESSLIEADDADSSTVILSKDVAEAAMKAAAQGETALNDFRFRCPKDDYAMTVVNKDPREKAFEMTDFLIEIFFNEQDREELEHNKSRDFLVDKTHPELTESVLATLVDWLVELQENYELNHETLYLAWSLVYGYLSRVKNIRRQDIQLVACAAIWVAAKYEERMPPTIENLTFITDDAYQPRQFLQAEQELLKVVDFAIYRPNAYVFLRRYSRILDGQNLEVQYMSRFILEASLHCHAAMIERQSKRAAAALWLARAVLGNPSALTPTDLLWPPTLVYCTRYSATSLKGLATIIHNNVVSMIRDGNRPHALHEPSPPQHTVWKYSNEVFRLVAKKYLKYAAHNLQNIQ